MSDFLLLPVATLAFPGFFTPKPNARGIPMYTGVLLFDKQKADLSALKKLIIATRDANFEVAKHASLKLGIRDGDKPNSEGKIHNGFAGHWAVSVSSKFQPLIVDHKVQKILDIEKELYAGCQVVAQVSTFVYKGQGNSGVSVGINAIQKVGEGTRLANHVDAATVFSPVPGSAAAGNGDSLADFANAPAKAADPFG